MRLWLRGAITPTVPVCQPAISAGMQVMPPPWCSLTSHRISAMAAVSADSCSGVRGVVLKPVVWRRRDRAG